jgi:hypothetical protein
VKTNVITVGVLLLWALTATVCTVHLGNVRDQYRQDYDELMGKFQQSLDIQSDGFSYPALTLGSLDDAVKEADAEAAKPDLEKALVVKNCTFGDRSDGCTCADPSTCLGGDRCCNLSVQEAKR